MDRRMDRKIDRQTYGQTDRRTQTWSILRRLKGPKNLRTVTQVSQASRPNPASRVRRLKKMKIIQKTFFIGSNYLEGKLSSQISIRTHPLIEK